MRVPGRGDQLGQSAPGGESSPQQAAAPRGGQNWSTGQIALQGAQIKHPLEFLLSRNQLISPLPQSIRPIRRRQSASSLRLAPRLALRPAITHLRPNPRQSPSALEWRSSGLESPVYLAQVLASAPLPGLRCSL